MIEIPQNGEREYFRAFGIVALFVAATPAHTPCLIGFTRDLGRSLESIRSRWHWSVELTSAWWMAVDDGAKAIVAAVTAAFPSDSHERFDADADAVAGKIEVAARSLQLKLTPHADAMRRVQLAVARVDSVIEAANDAGELSWFNATYRSWRTSAPAEAAMALPYGLARARLRAAVVRRLALGEARPIDPVLCADVFPSSDGPVPVKNPGPGRRFGGWPRGDSPQPGKRAGGLPWGMRG